MHTPEFWKKVDGFLSLALNQIEVDNSKLLVFYSPPEFLLERVQAVGQDIFVLGIVKMLNKKPS